jgi:hypothetical protein
MQHILISIVCAFILCRIFVIWLYTGSSVIVIMKCLKRNSEFLCFNCNFFLAPLWRMGPRMVFLTTRWCKHSRLSRQIWYRHPNSEAGNDEIQNVHEREVFLFCGNYIPKWSLTRKGYNGMPLHVMEQPLRFFALAYRASDTSIYQ